jgi:hypothetical protein
MARRRGAAGFEVYTVDDALANIAKAIRIPALRPKVAREVQLMGDRVIRAMKRQYPYQSVTARGGMKGQPRLKAGAIPDLQVDARGELRLRQGASVGSMPIPVGAQRNSTPRGNRSLVRISFPKNRRIVGALYSPAELKARQDKSDLRQVKPRYLLARVIRHSPEFLAYRFDRSKRKSIKEMGRRLSFLLAQRQR